MRLDELRRKARLIFGNKLESEIRALHRVNAQIRDDAAETGAARAIFGLTEGKGQ